MQKRREKARGNHTLFLICALFISLFNFAIFFVYVNIDTVAATFRVEDWALESDGIFYWYKEGLRILFDETTGYREAFGHTMIAMLINVIIFPLALITAYAFYKRVYGEKIFRVIFYLPSIIAITTLAMSFRELFLCQYDLTSATEQLGPITSLLRSIGAIGKDDVPLDIMTEGSIGYNYVWYAIIFFGVFTGLGTNVVLMCGAMMRIPVDITEALRLDGCGFFKEMFTVSIPMIMPTITTWLIMVVTSVFGFSITPMLLAGMTPADGINPRIATIPLIIYIITCGKGGASSLVVAQSLGVMFSLVIMPIVLIVRWVCEKLTPDISY